MNGYAQFIFDPIETLIACNTCSYCHIRFAKEFERSKVHASPLGQMSSTLVWREGRERQLHMHGCVHEPTPPPPI